MFQALLEGNDQPSSNNDGADAEAAHEKRTKTAVPVVR